MPIGALSVVIKGDISDFNRNIASVQKQLNASTKGLQTIGRNLTTVGMGMTKGVTLPILAIGVALVKLGNDFDAAYDTIRTGTGATGKALDGLKDDFRAIAKVAPSSFKDIGIVVADLNTRLGLTGKPLQEMSVQLLNFARITKTDINTLIPVTTRVFGDWNIATDKQSKTLDFMFRASQNTGIGIDSLAQKVVQFGAPLRAMGFDFETSITLLGKWEKEGVNVETVLAGLKIGLANFAREGVQDTNAALIELIEKIKNAGSVGEATGLAMEVFGSRAGPDMAAAIREGRFDLDTLLETLKNGTDTINDASAATMSWKEKLILLRNNIGISLEPLAMKVFDSLGKGIDKVTPKIEGLAKWFGKLTDSQQDNLIKWALIFAAIGPVLLIVSKTTTGVIQLRNAFLLLNAAIKTSVFLSASIATAAMYGMAEGVDRLSRKVDELYAPLIRLLYPLSDLVHGIKLNIEVIKGLKDGTISWIDLLKMSRLDLEEWAKGHREGTEAIEEQIPAIDKVKQSVDEFKQSLIDQGYTEAEATKQAKVHAEMMGYVADEQGHLEEAIDDTTEAIDDQTESVDKLRSAFNKLIGELFDGINANNDLQEAQWAQVAAQEAVNKLVKEGKQATQEYEQALNNLDAADQKVIESQYKVYTSIFTTKEEQIKARKEALEYGLQMVTSGKWGEESFIAMATQFGISEQDISTLINLKLNPGFASMATIYGTTAESIYNKTTEIINPALDTTQEKLDTLGKTVATPKITLDTSGFDTSLSAAINRLNALDRRMGLKEGGIVGFSQGGILDKILSASQGMMIPKFDSGGVLAMLHPPEIVLNAKEAMQLVWNMAQRPMDTKGTKGITNYYNITSPKPLTESEIKRQVDLLSREQGYRMGLS